jgi:hypothetical protein
MVIETIEIPTIKRWDVVLTMEKPTDFRGPWRPEVRVNVHAFTLEEAARRACDLWHHAAPTVRSVTER